MAYGIYMRNSDGSATVKSFTTLYHYTDMNALPFILRKDKIVLWASNCLYLNDRNEVKEGVNALQRMLGIQLHEAMFRSFYVTSFSSNGDDMPMWRMYGSDGHGCSLGFKPERFSLNNSDIYDICAPCTYGDESLDHWKRIIELKTQLKHFSLGDNGDNGYSKEKDIENTIVTACLSIKNSSFSVEQEVRGIKYCDDKDKVKSRVRNGIIIPYLEISVPKEELEEIVIGPTNNSDLALQSIVHHLDIYGYDVRNIRFKKSNVPYRG